MDINLDIYKDIIEPAPPTPDMLAEQIFDEDYDKGIAEYKKLGREARQQTVFSYRRKLTVEEFGQEIMSGLEPFIKNMKAYPKWDKPDWAEDWMEKFQMWMEMEKGDLSN